MPDPCMSWCQLYPAATVVLHMQAEQGALSASQAAAGEQQRRADAAETAHAQASAHAAQLQQELDHMRVCLSAHMQVRVDAAMGNVLIRTSLS